MARPKKSIDIAKTCLNCKQVFIIPEWEARRRERKYCSNKCRADFQTTLVNQEFFAMPSSSMAYVLGLTIADGYLGKRRSGRQFLSIKSIDKDLLETVSGLMQSQYGVYYCGDTDAGNPIWRIDVANEKLVSDLKCWGVHARKTFTVTYPDMLPDCFAPDFIRGLFDGDGHVSSGKVKGTKDSYYRRFSILGTTSLLQRIASFLPAEVSVKPYRKIANLHVHNRHDMQRIYDFLYYAADVPCLLRKRVAFETLLEVGRGKVDVDGFSRFNSIQQDVSTYKRERVFYGKRSADRRRKKKEAEQE